MPHWALVIFRVATSVNVSDDIHEGVTVNGKRGKKVSVLSCSRTVQEARTHCCACAWRAALAQIQGVSLAEQVELRTALTMQSSCEDSRISNRDTENTGLSLLLAGWLGSKWYEPRTEECLVAELRPGRPASPARREQKTKLPSW